MFTALLALNLAVAPVPTVAINDVTAEGLMVAVIALTVAPPELTFVIDSPGGSVDVGVAFVELMREAQAKGTRITCKVPDRGMAASMATYILEACDVRYMGKQSALLFHTVSVSQVKGNQWDIERLTRQMDSWNRMLAIFISGRMRITLGEYLARVADRDWLVGWEEAIAIGAVDGVTG